MPERETSSGDDPEEYYQEYARFQEKGGHMSYEYYRDHFLVFREKGGNLHRIGGKEVKLKVDPKTGLISIDERPTAPQVTPQTSTSVSNPSSYEDYGITEDQWQSMDEDTRLRMMQEFEAERRDAMIRHGEIPATDNHGRNLTREEMDQLLYGTGSGDYEYRIRGPFEQNFEDDDDLPYRPPDYR